MLNPFVVVGAGIVVYEVAADAFGWTLVSHFRGWRGALRDMFMLALTEHFREEAR